MVVNTADSLADYASSLPTKSIVTGADYGEILRSHEGFVGMREERFERKHAKQFERLDAHIMKGLDQSEWIGGVPACYKAN
jgi:hypothetical protein